MLSLSELNSFQKNGYLIKKSNDLKSLNKIQDLVGKYLLKDSKKVRISNNQNFIFVILLGVLHFFNFIRNRLLLFFGIKKSLNW